LAEKRRRRSHHSILNRFDHWRLGISRQHDPGDPLISALLDGGHARQASAPVPFELWVMGQMAASFTRRDGRSHPDNSHPDNNGQGS